MSNSPQHAPQDDSREGPRRNLASVCSCRTPHRNNFLKVLTADKKALSVKTVIVLNS